MDDKEVERSAAVKTLMRWVRLHDYNISQKVQIVVEHYRLNVQPLLDGKAKAMVVVGSRLEAVRWQLAIQKYIRERGYKLGTLVADRLLRSYRDAQARLREAQARGDEREAKDAQDELNALLLFRNDMGAYIRLYAFLSQIFDYGNTAIEARSIFYRRLIPLLEFGRQREEVDTSGIVLTHHKLTDRGARQLPLAGMGEKLQAIYDAGSGTVQEKERALLAEIIARVNDLFQGDTSDEDQLIYVNNVLKGKLLQSETLAEQAANNTKEQFSNSPDLTRAIIDAVIDAMDAHQSMSQQALGSKRVQEGLRDVLLGPGQLYEALRERREGGAADADG